MLIDMRAVQSALVAAEDEPEKSFFAYCARWLNSKLEPVGVVLWLDLMTANARAGKVTHLTYYPGLLTEIVLESLERLVEKEIGPEAWTLVTHTRRLAQLSEER